MIYFLIMTLFAIPMFDAEANPIDKHKADFHNKLQDPRMKDSNFIQRWRTKSQLKKNLNYKALLELNGLVLEKNQGQFIANANDIKNPNMLKEMKMQNALLKQQARKTYKEANAEIKNARAEIKASHGKWSAENFAAWSAHKIYKATARSVGVSGLGYQISKLTTPKPKPK